MIADTSVWIDFFGDRDTWQVDCLDREIAADRPVALTDVVYTEVLQGIGSDNHFHFIERQLLRFPILRLEGLDDFRRAAQVYREVRRQGHTVRRTSDCLIASVCIRDERPLLHSDVDFDRIAACTGLRAVEPG